LLRRAVQFIRRVAKASALSVQRRGECRELFNYRGAGWDIDFGQIENEGGEDGPGDSLHGHRVKPLGDALQQLEAGAEAREAQGEFAADAAGGRR